jgi:hypothetical protein
VFICLVILTPLVPTKWRSHPGRNPQPLGRRRRRTTANLAQGASLATFFQVRLRHPVDRRHRPLSHALPLLLRHLQGQNIQGLHDHALAMISHPTDKLGASSTHGKVKATHDWLVRRPCKQSSPRQHQWHLAPDLHTTKCHRHRHSAAKPSRK